MRSRVEDLRGRIANLVDSAQDDRAAGSRLFSYTWAMVCVDQGLMRVVREITLESESHLIVEEIRTGRQRVIAKPRDLDADVELLAVEAMARILQDRHQGAQL